MSKLDMILQSVDVHGWNEGNTDYEPSAAPSMHPLEAKQQIKDLVLEIVYSTRNEDEIRQKVEAL